MGNILSNPRPLVNQGGIPRTNISDNGDQAQHAFPNVDRERLDGYCAIDLNMRDL
jgi:hypothetical protein